MVALLHLCIRELLVWNLWNDEVVCDFVCNRCV